MDLIVDSGVLAVVNLDLVRLGVGTTRGEMGT